MYFFCSPKGERDDTLFKKPREVLYKNTRFDIDPFSKALNKSQIQQAAALNAQVTLTFASHWSASDHKTLSQKMTKLIAFFSSLPFLSV